MKLFEIPLALIAPHDCIGCCQEGNLICRNCLQALTKPVERCYRCQKPSPKSKTCAECAVHSHLDAVNVAVVYEDLAKTLIWKLKMAGNQDIAPTIARLLLPFLDPDQPSLIIPVPTATSRARQRGYDQAKVLAKAVAKQSRLPYQDILIRTGQMHQHGLDRQKRLQQMQDAYLVKPKKIIKGAQITLIDDVTTTGGTLESAASILINAGASKVSALVFAHPKFNKVQ